MNYQRRHVPLDYTELLNSVYGGEFPAERHWLDFKRELYPRPPANGAPTKAKPKREVHEELARDLASLAVRGGYLVFGVEEDKAAHTFTVVNIPLPAHLDQTVNQVARDFIDPPLLVAPTLLISPGSLGDGMMVVEVPESPDAPHMVGGTYYGRSETGRVKLTDNEVERLILQRGRADDRLHAAMAGTIAADRRSPRPEAAHFYLTAVPTQGLPDMLLEYTRDRTAHQPLPRDRQRLAQRHRAGSCRLRGTDALRCRPCAGDLVRNARGQQPRGAWFYNYPQSSPERN